MTFCISIFWKCEPIYCSISSVNRFFELLDPWSTSPNFLGFYAATFVLFQLLVICNSWHIHTWQVVLGDVDSGKLTVMTGYEPIIICIIVLNVEHPLTLYALAILRYFTLRWLFSIPVLCHISKLFSYGHVPLSSWLCTRMISSFVEFLQLFFCSALSLAMMAKVHFLPFLFWLPWWYLHPHYRKHVIFYCS